jgi:hypothetical protein
MTAVIRASTTLSPSRKSRSVIAWPTPDLGAPVTTEVVVSIDLFSWQIARAADDSVRPARRGIPLESSDPVYRDATFRAIAYAGHSQNLRYVYLRVATTRVSPSPKIDDLLRARRVRFFRVSCRLKDERAGRSWWVVMAVQPLQPTSCFRSHFPRGNVPIIP